MSDLEKVLSDADAIVDTYHAKKEGFPIEVLIEMRRELAGNLYFIGRHVGQVYGSAHLGYVKRKFKVAQQMMNALNEDAKRVMNKAEIKTEALDETLRLRTDEIEGMAEWECLRQTLQQGNQVLQSLQQEISLLGREKYSTHQQSEGHQVHTNQPQRP